MLLERVLQIATQSSLVNQFSPCKHRCWVGYSRGNWDPAVAQDLREHTLALLGSPWIWAQKQALGKDLDQSFVTLAGPEGPGAEPGVLGVLPALGEEQGPSACRGCPLLRQHFKTLNWLHIVS